MPWVVVIGPASPVHAANNWLELANARTLKYFNEA
jgi:hypothetical protein